MARQKRDTKAILKTIERSEQRSKLFWWMVDQHGEIIRKSNGSKIDWPSVCAEAAKRGKTDRSGNQASVVTAKKTWQRARKEVAAARTKQAALPPRPIYPSRVDKNWRPANAPPPPPPPPPGNAVAATAKSSLLRELMPVRKNPSQVDDYDPEANYARLQRIIAERSGH